MSVLATALLAIVAAFVLGLVLVVLVDLAGALLGSLSRRRRKRARAGTLYGPERRR